MNYEEFVKNVIDQFNNSGFDYALTGAVAVSYYTNPATTNEVDVIVRVRQSMLGRLAVTLRNIGFECDQMYLEKTWNSKFRVATFLSNEGFRLELVLTPRNIARRMAVIYGIETFVQEPSSLLIRDLELINNEKDAELKKKHMTQALSILKNAEVDVSEARDEARKKNVADIFDSLLTQVENEDENEDKR
ncbi:MAG: hypothetical protein QXG05_07195 [Nitrososphaerota archaeon]